MAGLKRSRSVQDPGPQPSKRTKLSGQSHPLTSRALRTLEPSLSSSPELPQLPPVLPLPLLSSPPSPLRSSLRLFARHGGPDLSDLCGLSRRLEMAPKRNPKLDSVVTSSLPLVEPGNLLAPSVLTWSTTVGSSRVNVREFHASLTADQILVPGCSSLPANLNDIQERLQRRRASLSPPTFDSSHFQDFQTFEPSLAAEASVMSEIVLPFIRGHKYGLKYCRSEQNLLFTNIKPVPQGRPRPKPDLFDGTHPDGIAVAVQSKLAHTIIPTQQPQAPIAPNFFVEVKGPTQPFQLLPYQISSDLSVGVRAMVSLQNYGQPEPVYDGSAYVLGSTFYAGPAILAIYTGHMTKSPAGTLQTHVSKLRSFPLSDSQESFLQGVAAFRNARDLAKEYRDELVKKVNGMAHEAVTPDGAVDEVTGKEKDTDEVDGTAYEAVTPDGAVDEGTGKGKDSVDDGTGRGKDSHEVANGTGKEKGKHSNKSKRPGSSQSHRVRKRNGKK